MRVEEFRRVMLAPGSLTKEVALRRPSVLVRELWPAGGAELKRIARTATHVARRQRAQILLASATGIGAAQIAQVVGSDETQVHRIIHEF
jgi:DNA-directed RNA polymerase specialized sigma24 family protein